MGRRSSGTCKNEKPLPALGRPGEEIRTSYRWRLCLIAAPGLGAMARPGKASLTGNNAGIVPDQRRLTICFHFQGVSDGCRQTRRARERNPLARHNAQILFKRRRCSLFAPARSPASASMRSTCTVSCEAMRLAGGDAGEDGPGAFLVAGGTVVADRAPCRSGPNR